MYGACLENCTEKRIINGTTGGLTSLYDPLFAAFAVNAKTPRKSGREGKENHDRPLRSDAEYMGFDKNAGSNYVYPNSTDKYPYREYQYKICKEAFFQNTLVVLPDGLGKSFIVSVVMYNIYRWYPMSKVIFLSASKSTLKGQMEACWNIMNIPKGDCVEITGNGQSTPHLIDFIYLLPSFSQKNTLFQTPSMQARVHRHESTFGRNIE